MKLRRLRSMRARQRDNRSGNSEWRSSSPVPSSCVGHSRSPARNSCVARSSCCTHSKSCNRRSTGPSNGGERRSAAVRGRSVSSFVFELRCSSVAHSSPHTAADTGCSMSLPAPRAGTMAPRTPEHTGCCTASGKDSLRNAANRSSPLHSSRPAAQRRRHRSPRPEMLRESDSSSFPLK